MEQRRLLLVQLTPSSLRHCHHVEVVASLDPLIFSRQVCHADRFEQYWCRFLALNLFHVCLRSTMISNSIVGPIIVQHAIVLGRLLAPQASATTVSVVLLAQDTVQSWLDTVVNNMVIHVFCS